MKISKGGDEVDVIDERSGEVKPSHQEIRAELDESGRVYTMVVRLEPEHWDMLVSDIRVVIREEIEAEAKRWLP